MSANELPRPGAEIIEEFGNLEMQELNVRRYVTHFCMHNFRGTTEELIRRTVKNTELGAIFVCKVINRMIVEGLLELHSFKERPMLGWGPSLRRMRGESVGCTVEEPPCSICEEYQGEGRS